MTVAETKRELKKREKKNKEIKGQISYYLEVEGYTKKDLALQLGICVATLYNKLKNPDTFTLEEVRNLKIILNLTDSQLLAII